VPLLRNSQFTPQKFLGLTSEADTCRRIRDCPPCGKITANREYD